MADKKPKCAVCSKPSDFYSAARQQDVCKACATSTAPKQCGVCKTRPADFFAPSRQQDICNECWGKEERKVRCPSCNTWMHRVYGSQALFRFSDWACPAGCKRSLLSRKGWHRADEQPIANAVKNTTNAVGAALAWSVIGLGLIGIVITQIGLVGGMLAVDWEMSRKFERISPEGGDLYFWAPKIFVWGILLLGLLLTKRLTTSSRRAGP